MYTISTNEQINFLNAHSNKISSNILQNVGSEFKYCPPRRMGSNLSSIQSNPGDKNFKFNHSTKQSSKMFSPK